MLKVFKVQARIGGESGVFMGNLEMFFKTRPSPEDVVRVLEAENPCPDAVSETVLARTLVAIREGKFRVSEETVYDAEDLPAKS